MVWRWLIEKAVIALHDEQIAQYGGSAGLRDHGLLSSALARPQNQVAYGEPSVFDLAAADAYGIIRNHPFVDGNKRIGFIAAYAFLDLNGWDLNAPKAEAYAAVMALAKDKPSETEFAAWLESNSVSLTKKK